VQVAGYGTFLAAIRNSVATTTHMLVRSKQEKVASVLCMLRLFTDWCRCAECKGNEHCASDLILSILSRNLEEPCRQS
jgi:hypothetical protein